jgi:hypothetical protein
VGGWGGTGVPREKYIGNGVSFKIEHDVSRFGIYNSTVDNSIMSVLILVHNTDLTMDSG